MRKFIFSVFSLSLDAVIIITLVIFSALILTFNLLHKNWFFIFIYSFIYLTGYLLRKNITQKKVKTTNIGEEFALLILSVNPALILFTLLDKLGFIQSALSERISDINTIPIEFFTPGVYFLLLSFIGFLGIYLQKKSKNLSSFFLLLLLPTLLLGTVIMDLIAANSWILYILLGTPMFYVTSLVFGLEKSKFLNSKF